MNVVLKSADAGAFFVGNVAQEGWKGELPCQGRIIQRDGKIQGSFR